MSKISTFYGFLTGVAITTLFFYQPIQYPDFLMLPSLKYQYVNIAVPTTDPAVYQPSRWTYKDIKKETMCLAKNIYYEARGQVMPGQIAVALVTFNRVKAKRFPDSICKVVWQKRKSKKTGKMVAQFSWTLDGNSNNPPNSDTWKETYSLAETMLDERSLDNFSDPTGGAQFYHNTQVDPYWNDSMSKVATIGEHIFYVH